MGLFGRTNKAEATIEIKANVNAAKRALKSVDASLGKMRDSMKSAKSSTLLTGAALAGLTVALFKVKAALGFVAESAITFEKSSSRLKAILKPTGEEFNKLEKFALKLGETTVFTASQVMDSFTEMGKLGATTNEILASGNEVLSLAALAQVDIAQAAQITIQTLNQFQLSAEETGRVVDVIAKSFTSSALDITKFSEAMKFIGPIAGTTGESIEDVTAAISVLADNAIESSLAGTAMRKIMLELANANSKASKLILGSGKSAETFTEKLKVLKDMQLDVTKTTDLFGLRATTGAQIIINNADAVEELADKYRDAEGAAKEMADTMLDNVDGAMIRLKSAQEGFALAFKEFTLPVLRSWNEFLIKINLGLKAIVTNEMKAINKNRAETKEQMEEQIALQIKILDLRNKIDEAESAGEAKVVIREGGRAVRLKTAKTALQFLIDKQKELLNVGDETKSSDGTKKPADVIPELSEEDMKSLEKMRIRIRKSGDKAVVQLNRDMTKSAKEAWDERVRIIKSGANAIEDINDEMTESAKEHWEKRQEISDSHNDLMMQDEVFRHKQRLILLEQQKEMYPKLVKEINDLIKAENDLHEDNMTAKLIDEENKRAMVRNAGFDAISTLNNSLASLSDAKTQRRIDNLDKEKMSEEEFEAAKAKIQEEGAKKSNVLARIQQGINFARAISELMAASTGAAAGTPGGAISRIAAMAAMGAAGMAMIAPMKTQKFATGYNPDSKRSRQPDNMLALINKAEPVIPAPQAAMHRDEITGIINNTANTAMGRAGKGSVTNNFYGTSTEQMLQAQVNADRTQGVGIKL